MNKTQLRNKWRHYNKDEKTIFWSSVLGTQREVDKKLYDEPDVQDCIKFSSSKSTYSYVERATKEDAYKKLDEMIKRFK